MAPIMRNPETLTVQQLKTELQKKKVSIPPRAKKDIYVELYRKHILREAAGFGFSSDEDEPPRSTRKVTSTLSARKGAYKIIFQDKLSDVEDMTDRKLRTELERRGMAVGPIVATTRPVYERKLADLLVREVEDGKPSRSQSTMVSFHDDDEEEQDEEEEDEDEEEDEEEEEGEEEEYSDSDLEEAKPIVSGRGDSSRVGRRVARHQQHSSSKSSVYRSSSGVKKSQSQYSKMRSRYCCGLPLWLWWLVILGGIVLFVYLVWFSMEPQPNKLTAGDKSGGEGAQ